MSDGVRDVLGDIYGGMRLRYVIEDEPLGTAGPGAPGARRGRCSTSGCSCSTATCSPTWTSPPQLAQHEETGRAGHARADRGRGHLQLRRGAHGRGRPGRGVPREVRRAGAHEPHQRRRLRARARAWSSRSSRAGAVSFEREVFPALVGEGGSTASPPPGTGSTSGRPSATSRPPTTCSPGTVDSTLPPRDETGSLIGEGCLTSGAHIGPQIGARRPLLGGQRLRRRALGAARPRDRGRRLLGARGGARRGVRVGDGARSSRARSWARARVIGEGVVIAAGARVQPEEALA